MPGWRSASRPNSDSRPGIDTIAGSLARSAACHSRSPSGSVNSARAPAPAVVTRMPSMPFCSRQRSSACGSDFSKGGRPITANLPGCAWAAASARSLRSPSQDGGTITARSTPAAAISARRSSFENGSGRCARCAFPAGHGRSGVSAPQICTCASTTIIHHLYSRHAREGGMRWARLSRRRGHGSIRPSAAGGDMADSIITDTATKIFQDLCEADTVNKAEKGEWPTALWDALEESGMPLMWVPDEFGGAGAELADGFAVLRVAGRFAAPVPLAETLLAGWLLAEAKIAAPAGPMTIAPVHEDGDIRIDAGGKLSGRARHVPFARNAQHIAVVATRGGAPVVALVAAKDCTVTPGVGLSGEPRDTVSFDGAIARDAKPAPGLDPARLTLFAAAARTQQMAGALERILDQSVT